MFPVLVADVDVREDSIFIRLRKEEVVCEDQDTSKRVSSIDVLEPVVEKVPEIGSEVTVPLETCGYLYVIIYTKNSYMYLSQN